MEFLIHARRTITSVWAKDVTVGDVVFETLHRYCESRCVDPVYREEGRVESVVRLPDGEVQIGWNTPYGESRLRHIPPYTPVMVIR